MIPTVREKKEVFVTKYDTQIADKTYTVSFQDTKEKDYTIDDIIEHILENVINAESYARYTNQKYCTEIILNLKEGVLENTNTVNMLLNPKENEEFFKDLGLTFYDYEEAYYFDNGELNLNVLGSILAKFIKVQNNINPKFNIGDKLVMLREEDRYVSDVFKVEDIYNGMYCFPYNEIEIEEVNKEFINIEDVLWYFEAKVLDPNGDEHWMKSIAEYDIFNKRMTIKEAKEYINEEVDYYTIVDVKPIYNLGFLTK